LENSNNDIRILGISLNICTFHAAQDGLQHNNHRVIDVIDTKVIPPVVVPLNPFVLIKHMQKRNK
jgi:hypothetical protein